MKFNFLLTLLVIFPINLLGQSRSFLRSTNTKEFEFLIDKKDILMDNNIITSIIREGSNDGYEILRPKNNDLLFTTMTGNVLVMTKSIYRNYSGIFPPYSVGEVMKHFFFTRAESIEESILIKVSTQIYLTEYSNVSSSAIDKSFNSIINYIKNSIRSEFNVGATEMDLSQRNMILSNNFIYAGSPNSGYSFLENFKISGSRTNQYGVSYEINRVFRYGRIKDQYVNDDGNLVKNHILGYTLEEDNFSYYVDLAELSKKQNQSIGETKDFLNFKINGKDLRDINTYDLKAMVSIFLEDCKRNRIPVPSIRTLKATFEPLDGQAIAYSYGMNNDSAIIIKVDPTKWQNSSKEKKWYIIYHELGHDVLNLNHGEGGKMMYNFADREYSWDEFIEDKNYMFNNYNK